MPSSNLNLTYAKRLRSEFPGIVIDVRKDRTGIVIETVGNGWQYFSRIKYARDFIKEEIADARAARKIHVSRICDGLNFSVRIEGGGEHNFSSYETALGYAERVEAQGNGTIVR